VEVGGNGRILDWWSIYGGYAYEVGELTSSQSATAPKGATLALFPRHMFSVWNRVNFLENFGAGLGIIHQTQSFTSTSNAVVLPGYTRVDAALYYTLNPNLRFQFNIENLTDERYYSTANSDTNITPGGPRAYYAGMTARF